MTETEMVGVAEAAQIIGVSTRTLHRLAKSGDLPHAHKNPRRTGAYLFWRADVQRLAHEQNGAA